MYLAVRFYRDVPNRPAGIPDQWPAEVVELGEFPYLPDNLLPSDGWVVMEHDDFISLKAQYQSQFDAWYAQYSAPTPQQIVQGKILSAKDFGESLLIQIATDNVLMGASQAQILNLIANNLPLILMFKSGSLYTALSTIQNFTPDSLMTQARIDRYVGEIKAYLGIP